MSLDEEFIDIQPEKRDGVWFAIEILDKIIKDDYRRSSLPDPIRVFCNLRNVLHDDLLEALSGRCEVSIRFLSRILAGGSYPDEDRSSVRWYRLHTKQRGTAGRGYELTHEFLTNEAGAQIRRTFDGRISVLDLADQDWYVFVSRRDRKLKPQLHMAPKLIKED